MLTRRRSAEARAVNSPAALCDTVCIAGRVPISEVRPPWAFVPARRALRNAPQGRTGGQIVGGGRPRGSKRQRRYLLWWRLRVTIMKAGPLVQSDAPTAQGSELMQPTTQRVLMLE